MNQQTISIINSKLILQKALLDFKGSLILVSHDVDFLRPIATKVIDIRKGNLKTYLGDIDYFLSEREFFFQEKDKSTSVKKEKVETINRKEQKRLEAEIRQQKHKATKDLTKEISKWEEKINTYENEIKKFESQLANPGIYSEAVQLKKQQVNLIELKSDLDLAIKKWEELNEKLHKIESQFN